MNPDYPKNYIDNDKTRKPKPKARYLLVHDSCEEAGVWKMVFEIFGGNTVAIRRYENDELDSTFSRSTEEARELWNKKIREGFRFDSGAKTL
jgi:hypothetical protein|tara:strand:+ start:900 stop:1175 length:276 start_codon:yes stop_codon:yes gene_type:complete